MTHMPQLYKYSSPELPAHIKCQILSYIRIEWAWVFEGDNQFWDYTVKDTHPVNFVIVERDVVISHAEVNQQHIEHAGETYKVYGLSAMFTYPAFRQAGYGQQVAKAATDYIISSDADVGMLFCLPPLKEFYLASGWTAMDAMQVSCGPQDAPYLNEGEITMCLFLSEKGRRAKIDFEKSPVYVGPHTW